MTLLDVMTLSIGVAVAMATSPLDMKLFLMFARFDRDVAFVVGSLFVNQTLCFVILGRQLRYARAIRPAEWIAFVSTANFRAIQSANKIEETLIDMSPDSLFSLTFDHIRLFVQAGLAPVAIGLGLAIFRVARPILPHWMKTLGFFGLAWLALCGPLHALSSGGPNWLAPAGGYSGSLASHLRYQAAMAVCDLPRLLLFAIPFMALFSPRRRAGPPWIWIEFVAPVLFLLSSICWIITSDSAFDIVTSGWILERSVVLSELVGALAIGWGMNRCLGRWWTHWIEGPPSPDASSASTP